MSYPTLTPEAEAFWSSLPQPEWALEMAAKQAATGNTEDLVRLCDCGSNIAMSHCTDCHAPVIEPTIVHPPSRHHYDVTSDPDEAYERHLENLEPSDDYDPDEPFEIYLESQEG